MPKWAPGGGAAAAAPEGAAARWPVGTTPTSTRRALVSNWPWQASHDRGLNEVPASTIRVINSCREAIYGGF
jgi:hypothetical protein